MGGGDSPLQSKGDEPLLERRQPDLELPWPPRRALRSATPEAAPLPDYATRGYTSPTAQVVKVPL